MSQLELGMIGAGGIAGAHLPGWLELGAKVTIMSTDGNAQKFAKRYADRGVTAVDTLDELLDRTTAVDICTPTYNHKEIALAAIRAGKQVACEKPLALTVEDAEEVVTAAEQAGVLLFPAHVVRYFPEYAAMQQAVAAGRIGAPAVLRFTRTGAFPLAVPWFSDPELSGGILMDQMIHDFDFARWLAGPVVRVHAQVRGHQQAGAIPGDTCAGTAVLTHASGAISHVHGVWGLPDLPFRTSFRIAGPNGILEHDSAATTAFTVLAQGARNDGDYLPNTALSESPYLTELRDFAAALAGGPAPRVTARDGLEAVRIGAAANASARTGRAVEITPADLAEGSAR